MVTRSTFADTAEYRTQIGYCPLGLYLGSVDLAGRRFCRPLRLRATTERLIRVPVPDFPKALFT